MALWSEAEDALLRKLYFAHTRQEIAERLGRTVGAVRSRCCTLGLNEKHAPGWTEQQLCALRELYEAHRGKAVPLANFSEQIGRHKSNVSRKARELGLTERRTRYVEELKPRRKYATDEERAAALTQHYKDRWKTRPHPRGMLGVKHSEKTLKVMGQKAKESWAKMTPQQKKARGEKRNKTVIEKYGTGCPGRITGGSAYSRCKGGKRADLGNTYFRSAWEANYARYLNELIRLGEIKAWAYEPKVFVFEGVTRGALTYTPDFLVTEKDGSQNYREVKGWMTSEARTRMKRMKKYYPEVVVFLIDQKAYRAIEREWSSIVANWERSK